jgi:16S rRNA (uracil1498-N3)-methyltransferase
MRLHRFYIDAKLPDSGAFEVKSAELAHQWKNVFRLKAGDGVILFDGSGSEFHGTLVSCGKDSAEVTITSREAKDVSSMPKMTLFAAVLKKNMFEWVSEKATELGVSKIVPVLAERSEKKNLNMDRLRKIVTEASEQSGRVTLPEIAEPVTLEEALASADMPLVAFHLSGETFDAKKHAVGKSFGALVGPEGGWSDAEVALFKEKNIPVVSLGVQVLRAETASVAVASLVLLGK